MNIDFNVTSVYRKNIEAIHNKKYRLLVNRGGSSSSKSISILQVFAILALEEPNLTITMVSETLPKLRRTILKDMKTIVMKELWHKLKFNKSELTLEFPNKSIIQFISADAESKIRGMRTDYLYIDEVDSVNEEIYTALSIRTRRKIVVSFNPSAEFYIKDEVESRNDVWELISTYKDNPFLEDAIIKELEMRAKKDPNFKRVFVDGEYGNLIGIIFEEGVHWQTIEQLPDVYDKEYFGMDLGYDNDPTTLVQIRIIGNDIYAREMLFQAGLRNKQLAEMIKALNPHNKQIISDTNEGRLVDDLRLTYGINIKKVKKENLIPSIANAKDRNIFVTTDSINLIKEFRYWKWSEKKKDKKGRKLPIDGWDHLIDAVRYVIDTLFKPSGGNHIKIHII